MKQPRELPSPVANSQTSWKRRLALLAIAVVGGLVLLMVVWPAEESEPVKSTGDANETARSALPPPQLVPAKPATPIPAEKPMTSPNEDTEKLQKLRLAAPLQAWRGEGGNAAAHLPATGGLGAGDANTQFMNGLANTTVPTAHANRLAHPSTTVAQGAVIAATLETRLISDLPGMVRAVVSESVYSEDGAQLLIPRGSRLIGQYTNQLVQGQSRVFVVWQRLIRPDFVTIQLVSPGTDVLGTAGLAADTINRHFLEQFGQAALLSIIGAGSGTIRVSESAQPNSLSSYREAVANSFAQSANQSWQNQGTIAPTLTLNQGTPITVLVARDLVFDGALSSGEAS
jgi:type IV secretion system protein VirB10